MKIVILNGPNLNLLGVRENPFMEDQSFTAYFDTLRKKFPQIEFTYFQSNVEGELINKIHEVGFSVDGIVFNAGAYTHTSLALADAISAVTTTVIEVHISNVFKREAVRHHSFIAPVCKGSISGFGMDSYRLAIEALLKLSEN